MSNDQNPFAAPKPTGVERVASSPSRNRARFDLRMALIVLLLPAVYNYYCFDRQIFRNPSGEPITGLEGFFRSINVGGIVAISAIVWLFGLRILELATAIIYRIAARSSQLEEWHEALYAILRSAVYFALGGAVLWFVWTIGFYQLKRNFYAISYPIGIAAHLLAAGLYLRLFYHWYRIEKDSRERGEG